MKEPYIETDYYKCRKNAERVFVKRRIKQLGIQWFIKQFFIWICFFFIPTHIGYDEQDVEGHNHLTVTYAKKIFDNIYFIKNEHYLDQKLISSNKMTLKEMLMPGIENYYLTEWYENIKKPLD